MKYLKGEFKRDDLLINRLNYFDEDNKQVSVDLREEKLLDLFLHLLQKHNYINKKITKEDFKWRDDELSNALVLIKDNEKFESVKFEILRNELNNYLNFEKHNFAPLANNLLNKFSSRKIKYVRYIEEDKSTEFRTILPIKDFWVKKINGEKLDRVFVSLNIEFIYLALFGAGNRYTVLDMNTIKRLKSKYSLRMYREIEKVFSLEEEYEALPKRSLKSQNNFFGTSLSKQKLDYNILRAKQEFLLNKMYSFDYEVEKNDNKEWIFAFRDLKKIKDEDNIFDYIKSYLDFRLLTPELQEKFKIERKEDYLSMTYSSYEKENKTTDSRTQHLQRIAK